MTEHCISLSSDRGFVVGFMRSDRKAVVVIESRGLGCTPRWPDFAGESLVDSCSLVREVESRVLE
jgi:hypothetical protein